MELRMEGTDQKLIEILKAAVYDVSLKELGDIGAETKITELGLDSVAIMELIGVLEENLSIQIKDEEVSALADVGDLLGLIRNRLPAEMQASVEAPGLKPRPSEAKAPAKDSECWKISDFPEVKNLEHRLQELESIGLKNPYFSSHDGTARNRSVINGVEMLNFSSYNYLGFSGHPEVIAAAKEAIDRYGTSVSASRLVSGERPVHRKLEEGIAAHVGVEAAVVFVSGHATNVTTIGHLFGKEDLILHDSLCHDSILQGIYLSGAKRLPFSHDNTAELEQILTRLRERYRRVLICTEGLFSMDGDICDLPSLIDLKKRFQCNLLVDEAHSIGVLGPSGRGIAHHFAGIDPNDADLWMGTLSKSFAGCGGYIAGSDSLVQYLKYTAPGFLYSVGMSPPNAAAALKSLELMHRYPEIVEQLRQRSRLFLELARDKGINTGLSAGAAVIPAIIGNSLQSMRLSHALAARRINVQPIVHPAVEENAARLRFFISATHTEEEIRHAVNVLAEEMKAVGSR
ncbi:MAG: aminotransferase class I/II-fold pyridoxal phosphate-dependent enzyme [Acidobacteria bacterium]|nr:aminotransferase class I/II-fold pyridoxal phosphate-dependent enzyme [Acidobacteriota bacterium]